MKKRIIVCSDGTMNTSFQTTRGGSQEYQPFSVEAFKANFFIWILGGIAGYYLYPVQGTTTTKIIAVTILLLLTFLAANEVYLQSLRVKLKDEDVRQKLLWRYIAKDRNKTPSHVTKISRAIAPIDIGKSEGDTQIPQIVFYDKGIGTGGFSDAIIGGGFGAGLKKNVLDCYNFIAENYKKDDEIFLFGFSRGAFTVRVLSGLIAECGLLSPGDVYYADEAYELFKLNSIPAAQKKKLLNRIFRRNLATNEEKDELLASFWQGSPDKGRTKLYGSRNEPCQKVDIHFLGVWDTVPAFGLVGILGKIGGSLGRHFRMNNFTLSKNVKHAYHALGLDENRRAFTPLLWDSPHKDGITEEMEQRWFIGIHTTVGGGFKRDQLSFIPFKWMIEKAQAHGLAFMETEFWHKYTEKEQETTGKEGETDTTYLEFFMPKESAYATYKNRNSPFVYLFEGFWKKRIVKLPDDNMEQKLLFSDRLGRLIFGKDSVNMRHDSKESVDESVYQRWNALPEYQNRARVADIPPQQ